MSSIRSYILFLHFKTFKILFFFSIRVFFHRHWRLAGQQGKGGDHLLFHSTTSTRSRAFRHLFATLHVRWLSHILIACIYQTATRWDLPPCRITIWLIDDVKFVLVCLLDDLILGFCYSNLDTGNRWTRTRIDYHPCITRKPTNQVWSITRYFTWQFYIFWKLLIQNFHILKCGLQIKILQR